MTSEAIMNEVTYSKLLIVSTLREKTLIYDYVIDTNKKVRLIQKRSLRKW